MPKVSEIYNTGGNFISAKSALENDQYEVDFEIGDVEVRKIKPDDTKEKMIVHFVDEEDVFVLNVTNANILRDAYGDDTDDWKGKELQLLPVKRNFRGKMVDAIEVRPTGQGNL